MKEQKDKKKKGNKGLMGSILNGTLLVREEFSKQFPFMVYITLLLMAIITNTYIAEGNIRELTQTTRRLNDWHADHVHVKSASTETWQQPL